MTDSIRLMVSDIVRAGRELAEQTRATATERERCPQCEGRGEIWDDDDQIADCPNCAGFGFLGSDEDDEPAPDDDAEERAAFDEAPPPDIEPLGDDEPREDYTRDLQDRFPEDG